MMNVEISMEDDGRVSVFALSVIKGGFKVANDLACGGGIIIAPRVTDIFGRATLTHRVSSPPEFG